MILVFGVFRVMTVLILMLFRGDIRVNWGRGKGGDGKMEAMATRGRAGGRWFPRD